MVALFPFLTLGGALPEDEEMTVLLLREMR